MLKTRYEITGQRSDKDVPVTIDCDGQALVFSVPGGRPRQNAAEFAVSLDDVVEVLAAIGASTPKAIGASQGAPAPKRQRKPPPAAPAEG